MIRSVSRIAGALVLTFAVAAPASAQIVQSFQFGLGGFFPRTYDGRIEGDVLVENLIADEPLIYNIEDLKSVNFFGEWIVSFGGRVEVSGGLGYTKGSVPSLYRDLVNELPSGELREIEQEISMRQIPVTGLVRFLPFGRASDVQPYVGAGIAAINWRYSEVGEFVDTFDYSVFDARFIDSGTTIAPVVLGGVRFPIGGDVFGLSMEYRYQWGEADLDPEVGFLSDRLDLAGGKFNVGFLIRF
jgi:hypothetical protein